MFEHVWTWTRPCFASKTDVLTAVTESFVTYYTCIALWCTSSAFAVAQRCFVEPCGLVRAFSCHSSSGKWHTVTIYHCHSPSASSRIAHEFMFRLAKYPFSCFKGFCYPVEHFVSFFDIPLVLPMHFFPRLRSLFGNERSISTNRNNFLGPMENDFCVDDGIRRPATRIWHSQCL